MDRLGAFGLALLEALLPLLVALVGYAVTRVTEALRSKLRDERVKHLLEIAAQVVQATVAAMAQTVVAPLKDPTRDGVWGADAGARVKQQALYAAREALGPVLAELGRHGLHAETLLDTLLEAAVWRLYAAPAPTLELPPELITTAPQTPSSKRGAS